MWRGDNSLEECGASFFTQVNGAGSQDLEGAVGPVADVGHRKTYVGYMNRKSTKQRQRLVYSSSSSSSAAAQVSNNDEEHLRGENLHLSSDLLLPRTERGADGHSFQRWSNQSQGCSKSALSIAHLGTLTITTRCTMAIFLGREGEPGVFVVFTAFHLPLLFLQTRVRLSPEVLREESEASRADIVLRDVCDDDMVVSV